MLCNLLAQADEPSGTLQVVDKIARTPISTVVLFLAACTIIRLLCYFYMKNKPRHERYGAFSVAKVANEVLDAIVYAGIFVFLIIRPYFIQTFHVPTGSMLDTLQLKDFLIANKFSYRFSNPKDGDIVIFKAPTIGILEYPEVKEMDYIKRLIGQPGDTVEVKNGYLYRNDKRVSEPYLRDPIMSTDFKLVHYGGKYIPLQYRGNEVNCNPRLTAPVFQVHDPRMMAFLKSLPPAKVPPGQYLFMGDNRNESYDGRAWGLVPRDSIIAKAEFIWFPLNRIGSVYRTK